MNAPSLRVYMVRHADGGRIGFAMRKQELLFDAPPPAAFGSSNQEVLDQLEQQLLGRLTSGDDVQRYLWDDEVVMSGARLEHTLGEVPKTPFNEAMTRTLAA